MTFTLVTLAVALVGILVPVTITLIVLVLLWRLLVHGSIRPLTSAGASPSVAVTGAYLGASVVIALVLLILTAPLFAQAAPEHGSVRPWAWGSILIAVPALAAAVLSSSRSARRTGTVRSASLEAHEPVVSRSTWVRTWAGAVATGLVTFFLAVIFPRLPLPRTTLADGSSAVVAWLQAPTRGDLALALAVVVVVSALGSGATLLIARRPAPQTGWDPRAWLVNWCCAVCSLIGGSWSVGLLLSTALAGSSTSAAASSMSTGLQIGAALLGTALLGCVLPRRVFTAKRVEA